MKYKFRLHIAIFSVLEARAKQAKIRTSSLMGDVFTAGMLSYLQKSEKIQLNELLPLYLLNKGSSGHFSSYAKDVAIHIPDELYELLYKMACERVCEEEKKAKLPKNFRQLMGMDKNTLRKEYPGEYLAVQKFSKAYYKARREITCSIFLDYCEKELRP